jgi:hypothetical protein
MLLGMTKLDVAIFASKSGAVVSTRAAPGRKRHAKFSKVAHVRHANGYRRTWLSPKESITGSGSREIASPHARDRRRVCLSAGAPTT